MPLVKLKTSEGVAMDVREQAVALRKAGCSLREIKAQLGISDHRLSDWLRGFPPAEWTKRPNAKDDLRERARTLRLAGKTYDEIVAELGVSKSTVSLWVRDLPKPPARDRTEHARMMNERRWEPFRRRRDAERRRTVSAAKAEVGALADRELLLIGVALYWAEGSKDKPASRRHERVAFTNSDPGVIKVFLRWLHSIGVADNRLTYRIAIHESADIAEAHSFWARVVGVSTDHFQRPTIKRHTPRTMRHNVGSDYHGCWSLRSISRRSFIGRSTVGGGVASRR